MKITKLMCICTAMLVASSMFVACSTSDNPVSNNPEIVDDSLQLYNALKNNSKISGIKQLNDSYGFGFKECYQFFYEQPIDHNDASKGTFLQEVVVFLRDVDAPTVLYTDGYNNFYSDYDFAWYNDIAYDFSANYVEIEHRHFGNSKIPSDTKWEYLTARQAAADHHEIINALKPLLKKEWISTGTSKDGMTSLFLRYYYPNDVDVTTAFCAPFMPSIKDPRVNNWLLKESGAGMDKEHADALLNRALKNGTDGLYAKLPQPYPFFNYVIGVLDKNAELFSYYDVNERKDIWPAADCTDEELLDFYTNGLLSQSKQTGETPNALYWEENPTYPYYIQSTKELGQYNYDLSALGDITNAPGFDDPLFKAEPKELNLNGLFDVDLWLYDTYDNSMILDILNNFLPSTNKPILLVYSKNDSWTGARPEVINNSVAKMIINPDGIHAQDINNPSHYSPAIRNEILDYISRYVKTPAPAKARGNAILPSVEPDRRHFFKRILHM